MLTRVFTLPLRFHTGLVQRDSTRKSSRVQKAVGDAWLLPWAFTSVGLTVCYFEEISI